MPFRSFQQLSPEWEWRGLQVIFPENIWNTQIHLHPILLGKEFSEDFLNLIVLLKVLLSKGLGWVSLVECVPSVHKSPRSVSSIVRENVYNLLKEEFKSNSQSKKEFMGCRNQLLCCWDKDWPKPAWRRLVRLMLPCHRPSKSEVEGETQGGDLK